MATYTVWNNTIPANTSSVNASGRTDGIQFTVSQSCQLTAIGYYLPASSTTTGSSYTAFLWTTVDASSGTLVSGPTSGSGTWSTPAWNWVSLGTPYTLSTGVTYVAGISSVDNLQFLHSYYAAGNAGANGFISGPISVPGVANAVGGVQQPFASAANTFPNGVSSGGTWYGVDIQVSVTGASAPMLTMVGLL